jgi:hypothetical protein
VPITIGKYGVGSLYAAREHSATILNRTMIRYAFVQLVLLFEKFKKAK